MSLVSEGADLDSPSSTLVERRGRLQDLDLHWREPHAIDVDLFRGSHRKIQNAIADEVDVSQQAVSQHLAVLDRAGLVEARKEGTRSVYAVRPAGFAPVECRWQEPPRAIVAATV